MKKYSIVFDNKCAICSITVKTGGFFGLIDENQSIELERFSDNSIACNVNSVKACDEMAVINNETLEVSYGYEGYINLVGVKHKVLASIMALKSIKRLMNKVYLFLASNRRVIAPIQPSDSTCSPTLKKTYRFSFIMFMALYAGIVTYLKGEIFSIYSEFMFLTGWKLVSITGLGWLLVGIVYRKSNKWEYWGHLAMIVGVAMFFQTIGLFGFLFYPSILWLLISMGLSEVVMIWMHYRRMKILGESQLQTIIWWLILHITASLLLLGYIIF